MRLNGLQQLNIGGFNETLWSLNFFTPYLFLEIPVPFLVFRQEDLLEIQTLTSKLSKEKENKIQQQQNTIH